MRDSKDGKTIWDIVLSPGQDIELEFEYKGKIIANDRDKIPYPLQIKCLRYKKN